MRKIDSRRLSRNKKDEILKKYDNLCVYCNDDAEEVDHIIPWAYMRCDSDENLVASCWLCNRIASDKVFDSIGEKRSHILLIRDRWLRKHPVSLWLHSEVADMGRALRLKIESECLLFDDQEDLAEGESKLLRLGFRINCSGATRKQSKTDR